MTHQHTTAIYQHKYKRGIHSRNNDKEHGRGDRYGSSGNGNRESYVRSPRLDVCRQRITGRFGIEGALPASEGCSSQVQATSKRAFRCDPHNAILREQISGRQFLQKAEKEFSNFEKQNLVYMSMNMELMLDDVEEILKRREVLNARQLMNDEDAAMDQVDLLVKQYDVFERGFEFQIQEIESLVRYLEQVSALKDRAVGQPTDRSADIELATCYHRSGEFWQAYREYLNCIELEPRCLSPCVELIQILMDCKLWRPAQRWLLKAESMFSASPEIGG